MSYQFADTYDHYSTAQLLANIMYELVNGSPIISSSYARFPAIASYPNQGVFIPSGNAFLRKNLKSNQSTLIAFRSYGCAALPGSGVDYIIGFADAGIHQSYLGVNSLGALQFYRQSFTGAANAIGPSTANGLIAPSTVPNHGIEIQITFSSSGGSVQCYLDGALVIPPTGSLNTIITANAYAGQVHIGSGGSGFSATNGDYCDYLRVWDNNGSFQNAIVGKDCRKLTKLPTGPGDLTNWTPNGAANNWQCVNDNPNDGDTTYVSASSVIYDSYTMGTANLLVPPTMIVAKAYSRKDDGATRALQVGLRSPSFGVNGLGTAVTMASSYGWVDSCISTDPNTGVPPNAAAADAYQIVIVEST